LQLHRIHYTGTQPVQNPSVPQYFFGGQHLQFGTGRQLCGQCSSGCKQLTKPERSTTKSQPT